VNFERYVINVFGLLFLFTGVRDSSGNAILEEWAGNQPNLRELVCVFGFLKLYLYVQGGGGNDSQTPPRPAYFRRTSQEKIINPATEGEISDCQSNNKSRYDALDE